MSDYCEWPDFYTTKWPIAKKEHKCCECYAPIKVGERYGNFTGKWPGDKIRTHKQHLICEMACRFIRDKIQDGECIGFGELWEIWDEYKAKHNGDERQKNYRSIVANFLWQKEKKRPLFFKTKESSWPSLSRDRGF